MLVRLVTIVAASLVAALVMIGGSASAGTLQVVVTGMGDFGGRVHIGIFNDPDTFPRSGKVEGARVAVLGDEVVAEFDGLPPGEYAVAAYYDADGDGEFDTSALGLPQERYGFSNFARAFLGPPRFADAAFAVDEGRTRVRVTVD